MLEVDSLRVQEISIYISQWITHVVKWYRKIQSKFSLNTVAYKCWCLPFAKTEILVSRLKSASHLEICIYLSFFLTKILLCYFLQKSSEINQGFYFWPSDDFKVFGSWTRFPHDGVSILDHQKDKHVWHLDSISSCVNWSFFFTFYFWPSDSYKAGLDSPMMGFLFLTIRGLKMFDSWTQFPRW